jgi:hypothetical protein
MQGLYDNSLHFLGLERILMIKNETLQDKKIYDNYENLMENSKNNFIVRIYKLVILGLIALATLMILIFAKQTIMGEKI